MPLHVFHLQEETITYNPGGYVAMAGRKKKVKLDHFGNSAKAPGGIKQRLARQQETHCNEKESFVGSELAHYLLSRFAWGELSPQELQRIAMLAIRDVDTLQASNKSSSSSSSSATTLQASKLLELLELSKIGVSGNMALQQHLLFWIILMG